MTTICMVSVMMLERSGERILDGVGMYIKWR